MSDEEEDDLGIKPVRVKVLFIYENGTVIDSSKANYVVIKLLGEGGFGAVFKLFSGSVLAGLVSYVLHNFSVTRWNITGSMTHGDFEGSTILQAILKRDDWPNTRMDLVCGVTFVGEEHQRTTVLVQKVF